MKQFYYNRLAVAKLAAVALYLPIQAHPIKNGVNGEPKAIDVFDVRNLTVRLLKSGETGVGHVLPFGGCTFSTLYNMVIVNVPAASRDYKVIVDGDYGCVRLHAVIDCVVGNGGTSVLLNPYTFEVIGDCAFPDIAPHPLCFTNTGSIGVGLGMNVYNDDEDDWHPNLQVSQNGIDWRDVTEEEWGMVAEGDYPFALMQGMSIYFRGMNPDGYNVDSEGYDRNKFSNFVWSHEETTVKVSGDIMSLINYEERVSMPQSGNKSFIYLFGIYDENTTALTDASELIMPFDVSDACYSYMFANAYSLVSAPALPATTLAANCYDNMFSGCTSLVIAPALPATTLADSCYYNMFIDCSSLVSAPALPATTLADNCYGSMFSGCMSLVSAPALPATTLAANCYGSMFSGCMSLVSAPALPATTLAANCYDNMFRDCTSLVIAPALPATTLANYCYGSMFSGCRSLVIAPALPATTLAANCYGSMFSGCRSLVSAPALPATTLANYCYIGMFLGCTSLVNAPVLPSLTLVKYCYGSMFNGCMSLVSAPALPATTLAANCYDNMFRGCTSLVIAPALPATTLAANCYGSMFSGCRSLVSAPALPATTLAANCYGSMFSGCTNLGRIEAMFLTTPSSSYTHSWVDGVAESGVFVKNAAATWEDRSVNGIPANWQVELKNV